MCENQSPEKLIKPIFISHEEMMKILGVKQTAKTNQPLVLCQNGIMKHMLQFVILTYHAVIVEPLQRAVKPSADTARMQRKY